MTFVFVACLKYALFLFVKLLQFGISLFSIFEHQPDIPKGGVEQHNANPLFVQIQLPNFQPSKILTGDINQLCELLNSVIKDH